MRKVVVLHPPINYVVLHSGFAKPYEIAWFISDGDAEDFVKTQPNSDEYEIAEVRK